MEATGRGGTESGNVRRRYMWEWASFGGYLRCGTLGANRLLPQAVCQYECGHAAEGVGGSSVAEPVWSWTTGGVGVPMDALSWDGKLVWRLGIAGATPTPASGIGDLPSMEIFRRKNFCPTAGRRNTTDAEILAISAGWSCTLYHPTLRCRRL